MKNYFFTSEAITPGHPDKICDQIADAILDEALRHDIHSKMAVECTIKDELIIIYGEANTKASINYEEIALRTIKSIGYNENYQVLVKVSNQSAEINNAVEKIGDIAAGDQGIMFGFASDETDVYMPLSHYYATRLAKRLTDVFTSQEEKILKPDGKTQVTIEYINGEIARVSTIVVSTQHYAEVSQEYLHTYITENVIKPVIDPKHLTDTRIIINPSGSFIVGGSFGDSGTTGRKIVVDTYGGHGRIGGGCLSSKDPSKVDRSAAYYCRYVAKNIVANKLARKCEIQVSYAIGLVDPLSLNVNCFDTNTVSEEKILEIIQNNFNFSVTNIINELNLLQPIYQDTANFGHFGRDDIEFPWEKIISLKVD